MTELAVVTPSFGPDAELFAQLHASVLEHTTEDTVHHVIVPAGDRERFAGFAGPRCRVWTEPELLPRRYVRVPRSGLWVNALRPWPPIRGWVIQQALKLAATARAEARAVLVADSDIVLVRPVDVAAFRADGQLRLHRVERGVHAGMPRHVRWHQVARDLLGLPPAPPPPLHDYVSSLTFWDPVVVRAMQGRIAESAGRPWLDAFNARLHISEFILYGVFVDELYAAGGPPAGDDTICHNYWDRTPLDRDGALAFADRLGPEAIGMMISAKSGTPPSVREAAVRRCAEVAGG
ncbi:DUF6492 family protein [Nonomuraea lactucae]|uniref:DUF6492 family protein n=1 Tax=Nonomuraea lactucae TaxID=2249762 RepID=UPI000DE53695|nr:DUF6492 family protein [Nonomuraea lactucae]